jgi:hypothetical protein
MISRIKLIVLLCSGLCMLLVGLICGLQHRQSHLEADLNRLDLLGSLLSSWGAGA